MWTYGPSSGPGSLDRPSLAVRWPNGMIAVTDDWHHRVVVIDPRTKRIVWQYGHFGIASSADGYLSKPDGLDLLPAPFARAVRRAPPASRAGSARCRRPHHVVAVTALPGGRLLALGGLVGGSIVRLDPGRQAGLAPPRRPPAGADARRRRGRGSVARCISSAAASRCRRRRSSASIRRPAAPARAGNDRGAAVRPGRRLGRRYAYLVGGYTGSRFATAILRFRPGSSPTLVARLPDGLRYAGVAMLCGRIYVAGGVTTSGTSGAVYAVDPRRRIGDEDRHAARARRSRAARRARPLPLPHRRRPTDRATRSPRSSRIDPASGTVAPAGSLPGPLADAAATRVGCADRRPRRRRGRGVERGPRTAPRTSLPAWRSGPTWSSSEAE